MSNPFLGIISMFAGNFAPRGWAFCNGQLMSIAQNTALFSLLGTTYGGDGQETFGLPNVQGRMPVHFGQLLGGNNYALGEMTGSENITLTNLQMPVHNHATTVTIGANASPQTSSAEPGDAVYAGGSGQNVYAAGAPDGATTMNAGMATSVVGVAGGSQPFSILQPYLVINYIIALEGIFPSRN